MLKTIKGKVIAGVVAIGFVSGATVAFGATDAGAKLKAWYDVQFGQASANVESESEAYLNIGLDGVMAKFDGLKADATANINDTRDGATKESKANIEDAAGEHIDSIKTKQKEIEGYMDSEFGVLKEDAKKRITSAGDALTKYTTSEMNRHTVILGNEAQKSVTTELKVATDLALSDLEEAIRVAKAELQSQLNTKASATTKEIKILIDNKVKELSSYIAIMSKKMVDDQQKLIEKKAQEMEDIAKQQMQDLVSGI